MKKLFSLGLLTLTIFAFAALTACGGDNGYDYEPANSNIPSTANDSDIADNGMAINGYIDPDIPPDDLVIDICPIIGRPLFEFREGRLWHLTAGFTEVPMDLGGRNIHIVTGDYHFFNYWERQDATPNETIRIMGKLRDIEEDYNMTFTFAAAPRSTYVWQDILTARLAGEVSSEIVNLNIGGTNPDNMFRQGVFLDLYTPHVAAILDFENNPWHDGRFMSNLWGRQHGVHFTTANSGAILGSMLTFNIEFMDRFQLGNLFELVHNNAWTFSNFENTLRWVQYHSNGTVLPLAAASESGIGPGFIFANGGRTVEHDAGGHLVFVGHENDLALEAVNFLSNLRANGLLEIIPGLVIGVGNRPYEMYERAAAGRIMFMSGEYEIVRHFTRQQTPSEFIFGLLPIPRGDHMEDHVAAMLRYDMYYIVYDAHNQEEIAAILLAMANRLSKMDIVEHELRHGLRDAESGIILEMMLQRQVIDYSRMVSVRGRISTAIRDAINGHGTIRMQFESIEPSVRGTLNDLRTTPN